MIVVVVVIALTAGLMGSAATDGGAGITKASNAAQSAIVKAVRR